MRDKTEWDTVRHKLLELGMFLCKDSKGYDTMKDWAIAGGKCKDSDICWRRCIDIRDKELYECVDTKNWESVKNHMKVLIKIWNDGIGEREVVCNLTPSIDKMWKDDADGSWCRVVFSAVFRP